MLTVVLYAEPDRVSEIGSVSVLWLKGGGGGTRLGPWVLTTAQTKSHRNVYKFLASSVVNWRLKIYSKFVEMLTETQDLRL
jgi:hypothetical protein